MGTCSVLSGHVLAGTAPSLTSKEGGQRGSQEQGRALCLFIAASLPSSVLHPSPCRPACRFLQLAAPRICSLCRIHSTLTSTQHIVFASNILRAASSLPGSPHPHPKDTPQGQDQTPTPDRMTLIHRVNPRMAPPPPTQVRTVRGLKTLCEGPLCSCVLPICPSDEWG